MNGKGEFALAAGDPQELEFARRKDKLRMRERHIDKVKAAQQAAACLLGRDRRRARGDCFGSQREWVLFAHSLGIGEGSPRPDVKRVWRLRGLRSPG